jgi:hypothetical protein
MGLGRIHFVVGHDEIGVGLYELNFWQPAISPECCLLEDMIEVNRNFFKFGA